MIVELKDKGIELEFPDDMPQEQIKEVIKRKFYSSSSPVHEPPATDLGMVDSPMPAVPGSVLRMADQAATKYAPEIGYGTGALTNIPLVGPMLAAAGQQYKDIRGGFTGPHWQSPIAEQEQNMVDAGMPIRTGPAMKEGALGLAGDVAGGVAGKILSPVANKAGQIGEWFQQEGLPRLGNRASKWVEELTGLTITGSSVAGKYRKQIQDWALEERNNILSGISNEIKLPSDIGQDVGKQVVNVFKEPKQLYGDFAKMGGEIELPGNIKQIAHKWLEFADPHDKALLETIINNKSITTQEISNILGGKQLGVKEPGLRNELKEAFGKHLEEWDKLNGTYFKVARDAANESYKELAQEWATNPRALAILREYDPAFKLKIGGETLIRPNQFLSTRPEKVVEKMFNTGNADELIQLRETMPKEVWDGALASFLEQKFIISKAYNPETRQFNPWPWSEAWTKHREVISKVEPEVAKRIDKFTEMTTKVKEQLMQEVPSFVSQAKQLALPGALAFGGARGILPLWTIPVVDGFGGLMAWKFLGPNGKGSFAKLVGKTVQIGTGEAGIAMGE